MRTLVFYEKVLQKFTKLTKKIFIFFIPICGRYTMFKINFSRNTIKPIKTIEQEMQETRARYQHYLDTTSNNYMAKRANVTIKDPHTMVDGAYKELRESIDMIDISAKKANKEVTFEDARTLIRDCEDDMPSIQDSLSHKVLITVKDKSLHDTQKTLVDKFEEPELPFMKKISNALGEIFTGKKGSNIDSELGLK